MKKIFNLTGNETFKQLKKINIKVIIALILVFAVALPIIIKSSNNSNTNFMIENYKHDLRYTESQISELSKINSPENKNKIKFLEAQKETTNLYISNNIRFEEWKRNEMDSYSKASNKLITIDGILEGVEKKVIMDSLMVSMYANDPGDVEEYFNLSKDELKKKKDSLIKEKEEIKKSLAANDYLAYVRKSIKNKETEIEKTNKQIKELEKQIANKKDEKISTSIEALKAPLKMEKELLELDKYRLKNRIPYDDNDWRNNTLQGIRNSTMDASAPMYTEEEYKRESAGYMQIGKTYAEYKEIYLENKDKNEKNIKLGWYSLNNNIPQLDYDTGSRGIVNKGYDIFVMISAILSIIIAGGIVSSEFSKGTVRLLLIRPVSRFKILLSKLLAVFLIGYAVLVLSIIVLTVSSGFVFGFDGLSTNVLSVVSGEVVEKSFLMYVVPNILFSSISLIFVISLAFMISTIAKNTALSVGLSSILFLGSMPITMILANFKMAAITKYVLAYINLPVLKIMPDFGEMLKAQYGVTLNINSGAIQLLVCSVIFIVASFAAFTKSDVKN